MKPIIELDGAPNLDSAFAMRMQNPPAIPLKKVPPAFVDKSHCFIDDLRQGSL